MLSYQLLRMWSPVRVRDYVIAQNGTVRPWAGMSPHAPPLQLYFFGIFW